MQTRLFVLMAVSNETSDQMNNKIRRAAVTRMLNLRNILELINDGLDDRSFAQQQLVGMVHEMVLHVFAQSGDEVESLLKKQLSQGSGNVAAISEQLAAQVLDHAGNRCSIIDIAWSQTTGKQVSLIVDCQMQLKAKEPAHRRLATFGISRKDAVLANSFGIAHFK